jgi:flavin reductase (DIM6/NTAB) family NADH-FMN oxidoreductase RutF
VVVVTVRDGRDDLGTTVTAFMSVSVDPPMVAVAVDAEAYLSEVLHRQDRWAATVLAARQRPLAGRFAAQGRPSARLLIANEPHHRGPVSDALIVDGGLTALECRTRQRVPAGDHVLFLADVPAIDYVSAGGEPLVRVNRRYL